MLTLSFKKPNNNAPKIKKKAVILRFKAFKAYRPWHDKDMVDCIISHTKPAVEHKNLVCGTHKQNCCEDNFDFF